MQVLNDFAHEGNDSPRVIEALGHRGAADADAAGRRAGHASAITSCWPGGPASSRRPGCSRPRRRRSRNSSRAIPETPNVHYAYGVFLTAEQPDKAIEQFKEELKISPRHPLVGAADRVRVHQARGDWEAARPWAEQAVTDDPGNFVGAPGASARCCSRRATSRARSREFEAGVKIAPDSPAMRFALARAYRRAGRERGRGARAGEVRRSSIACVRTQRTGAQSVGGMEMDRRTTPGADLAAVVGRARHRARAPALRVTRTRADRAT